MAIKIYGTLENATESGKIAYAQQLYDSGLDKFQSQINLENAGAGKFRFAHWNVGHFTYYDGIQGNSTPSIPAQDSVAMALRFKKAINEIDADVLGICEDDPYFDAAGNTSISKLYYKYGVQRQGTKYNYMCASIYSNLPLDIISVTEVTFPQTVQANRYYKYMIANLWGKRVNIVETHLDWDQGEHGADYRAAQILKLLADFSNEDYVILSADYNVADPSEWDAFTQAGYSMANHGYIDDIITHINHQTQQSAVLDNIIVKGFCLSNIKVWEDTLDLSDHAAISCDLTMC